MKLRLGLTALALAATVDSAHASSANYCAKAAEILSQSTAAINNLTVVLGFPPEDLQPIRFDGAEKQALEKYQAAAGTAYQALLALRRAQRDAVYQLENCGDQ